MAYAVTGRDQFPSVRYAARRAEDPNDGLGLGEASLIDGRASQTDPKAGRRWGDYTTLEIDPVDDCTMWTTGQRRRPAQVKPGSTRKLSDTQIVAFRLPGCG